MLPSFTHAAICLPSPAIPAKSECHTLYVAAGFSFLSVGKGPLLNLMPSRCCSNIFTLCMFSYDRNIKLYINNRNKSRDSAPDGMTYASFSCSSPLRTTLNPENNEESTEGKLGKVERGRQTVERPQG